MKKLTRFMFLSCLVVTLAAGCTTIGPRAARSAPQASVRTELHCELPEGAEASPVSSWQQFLAEYVTPRFESGWWTVRAEGRRMTERGPEDISSRVLVLIHEDSPAADQSIEHIRAAYQQRYGTPVLRVSTPAYVSARAIAELPRSQELGILQNSAINESSGLAFSSMGHAVLWTHNDSGDRPRFFALGLRGEARGEFYVTGADAVDWEDMCWFSMDGESYLLFADVGDNARQRDIYQLYIVKEPEIASTSLSVSQPVELTRKIEFVYEDGPHNCESVAVDPFERVIYLVSKNWGWDCHIYSLPLDDDTDGTLTATALAEVGLPRTTAMDLSPDRTKMAILTYGDAYEFERGPGETWTAAFERDPEIVPMPNRKQGESICYGPDGLALYLTSEQLPAPLWEVVLGND